MVAALCSNYPELRFGWVASVFEFRVLIQSGQLGSYGFPPSRASFALKVETALDRGGPLFDLSQRHKGGVSLLQANTNFRCWLLREMGARLYLVSWCPVWSWKKKGKPTRTLPLAFPPPPELDTDPDMSVHSFGTS